MQSEWWWWDLLGKAMESLCQGYILQNWDDQRCCSCWMGSLELFYEWVCLFPSAGIFHYKEDSWHIFLFCVLIQSAACNVFWTRVLWCWSGHFQAGAMGEAAEFTWSELLYKQQIHWQRRVAQPAALIPASVLRLVSPLWIHLFEITSSILE